MEKIPVAILALDREDRSPGQCESAIREAADSGARLVVVPFGFPEREANGSAEYFARIASSHKVCLVAGFEEEGRRVAVVFSPEGTILGTTAQTHQLPDEDFTPGDRIAPIPTPLGTMGLSVGSDIYFPEVHWSLAQQGADILVHLDVERDVNDHFYSVLSPRVRAFDVHRPFLIARPTSELIKIVHNESMGIPGVPMAGSVIIDQNGAVLGSTGFSQGVARADLRLDQHCRSPEMAANMPVSRGLDVWKLYFNDSRKRYFHPLREPFSPRPKPAFRQRKIRIAVLTHGYSSQVGSKDGTILRLLEEACQSRPDIIMTTEMEQGCRPDDPEIAEALSGMVALAKETGSYLLVGGVRPKLSEKENRRVSHGWLWDRTGNKVFESRIMLYGRGCGQGVFDTDFGRVGIRLCGDVYAPELDRLFALQGADIIFNPSMSWGSSGLINTELNQARAMDNGLFVVSGHLAFSDAGQRSHVIDPMGAVVATSAYDTDSVLLADIDLDNKGGVFIMDGTRKIPDGAYLREFQGPRPHRRLPPGEMLKLRHPELYVGLNEDRPDHPFTTRNRGDGVVTP